MYIYRAWIPNFVKELFGNFSDKVKDQDDKHDERADDSPSCLPEDVGFVSNHELNVVIEPIGGQWHTRDIVNNMQNNNFA